MQINLNHQFKAFITGFTPAFLVSQMCLGGKQEQLTSLGYPYLKVRTFDTLFFQNHDVFAAFAKKVQDIKESEEAKRRERTKDSKSYVSHSTGGVDVRLISEALGCPPGTLDVNFVGAEGFDEVVLSYNGIVFVCTESQVPEKIKWLQEHRPLPENGFIAMWNAPSSQWIRYSGPESLPHAKWTFEKLMGPFADIGRIAMQTPPPVSSQDKWETVQEVTITAEDMAQLPQLVSDIRITKELYDKNDKAFLVLLQQNHIDLAKKAKLIHVMEEEDQKAARLIYFTLMVHPLLIHLVAGGHSMKSMVDMMVNLTHDYAALAEHIGLPDPVEKEEVHEHQS